MTKYVCILKRKQVKTKKKVVVNIFHITSRVKEQSEEKRKFPYKIHEFVKL